MGGPFLWDDKVLIPGNGLVHSFEHVQSWFTRSLFDTSGELASDAGATRYYRPWILGSFAFDWWLGKDNPVVYHASNLLLFAANLWLVRRALSRFAEQPGVAWLGTLIFALHPTRAESVAWISGRSDLWSTLFMLLVMEAVVLQPRRPRTAVVLGGLATVLAYLSKETAVVLPVLVALTVWCSMGRPALNGAMLTRLLRAALPQLGVAIFYLLARTCWLPFHGPRELSVAWLSRLGLFFETLGRGAGVTLWPFPSRMQHGLIWARPSGVLVANPWWVGLGILVLMGVLIVLTAWRRRFPRLWFTVLLAAVAFAPVSNALPTRLTCMLFERFLYLPHLVLALGVTALADSWRARPSWPRCRKLARPCAGLVVLALFGLAANRAADFGDARRFWTHEARVNPQSSVAPLELSDLALAERKPVVALRWLAQCQTQAELRRQSADANNCLLKGVELIGHLTPDHDTRTLQAVRSMLLAALSSAPRVDQTLDSPLGRLRWIASLAERQAFRKSHPGRVEAALANIESRLELPGVEARVAAAVSACLTCSWSPPLALVLATEGSPQAGLALLARIARTSRDPSLEVTRNRLEKARQWQGLAERTTGPVSVHAQAQSLLILGRPGLALRVLLPHRQPLCSHPESARDMAEISARAGELDIARHCLFSHLPSPQIEDLIASWQTEELGIL